ncbi:tRNA wybutosine-synthesizing protein 4 [Podosphaera aphanis]|nr:tRNA wybutosine-synthesizing protein 4 [Podosphaera aphanis]
MHIPEDKPSPRRGNDKQDEYIMGTNNSSIVSKRSVERIYFSHEPQFFRYFVKKPQRRSPLINRGYWLRMKAIDHVVSGFLKQKSSKQKVVINVGCGFDPLPWQCLSRYPEACSGVVFIDIDYRDLILRKRTIVHEEPNLSSILSNVVASDGPVLLHSDQYIQVGCDLHKLTQLNEILSSVIKLENCMILLTAEVSITYMNVNAADDLIQWASTLPDAYFCLLEQLLPAGEGHPFGQTMMAHFKKLNTPLGAVKKYPTTQSQQERFENLGWNDISVQNLWKLWSSTDFLSTDERIALDTVEPFDEWEEFALFANHYFLLTARSNKSCQILNTRAPVETPSRKEPRMLAYTCHQKSPSHRRCAAALFVKPQARGKDRIALFGGMGKMSRLNSRDEYTCSEQENTWFKKTNLTATPSSRMCHTITDLGDAGALLVGGRTSPDMGLSDCWIYHKWLDAWEKVDSLPWPLYRHQALKVGSSSVLVSTGRINSSTLSDSFLLWSRNTGWVRCNFFGITPYPVCSPVFFIEPGEGLNNATRGVLAGGIGRGGIVVEEILEWELIDIESENPALHFRKHPISDSEKSEILGRLCRVGACTIKHLDKVFIIGGIVKDRMLLSEDELCCLEMSDSKLQISSVIQSVPLHPWPLFIGSSVISTGVSLVVLGGYAVCFSFGTFWNQICLTLAPLECTNREEWRFLQTVDAKDHTPGSETLKSKEIKMIDIPRIKLQSQLHFDEIRNAGRPVIFKGLDLGSSTTKWNIEYLRQTIGEARDVIVHKAATEHMDFTTKNFQYCTMKFGEFTRQVEEGARLYLRSLSDQPFERPVNLEHDFSTISPDFSLPSELSFVTQNAHSSPLRISGPVTMWLHYDTLANVLCQIQGPKRLILFHPADFQHLGFEPGATCSATNVFESLARQELGKAQPYEASLQPGDVLYLPPLWLHTAAPVTGLSIAVNVFFKDLAAGYAAGKDVYGNRDFQPYEKGRLDVARITASFAKFPPDIRAFYLQRLALELAHKATTT